MQTIDENLDDCDCHAQKAGGSRALADTQIQCLACGHVARVSVPLAEAPSPLDHGIFRCDECRARMVYGKLLFREVVEPFVDERGRHWLRRRFQDAATKVDVFVVDVDPQFAAMVARDMLDAVIPGSFSPVLERVKA